MKLSHPCPQCHEPIKSIVSEAPFCGDLVSYVYNCGHMELKVSFKVEETFYSFNGIEISGPAQPVARDEVKEKEIPSQYDAPLTDEEDLRLLNQFEAKQSEIKSLEVLKNLNMFKSLDGTKEAYDFQKEGVAFAEKSGFNCLIADEMGLGKTIQSALALKKHPELFPSLIIVKGATLFQWPREIQEWCTKNPFDVCIITSRMAIMPGFKYYIISMDLLSRKGIHELLLKLGLKCVIIDECQNFKDASSKRTIALIKLLQEGNIEHKIALSGTPIKNRANEYFVILNLLAPAYFTSYHHFCRQFLLPDDKGVYTRINPTQEDYFNRLTSRWIIRRKQSEVQKDLPEMRINYQFCEIEDAAIRKSYNFQLDLFDNFLRENGGAVSSVALLGWLAKLRAITGQAKVPNAVEFTRDFFNSVEDGQKMTIGIHHRNVMNTLKYVFDSDGYAPLTLSGEDSNFDKNKIVEKFKDEENRLLIMNSIAGGVGLNLQHCNNFLALERQWNGADEDQFHKRFHRDGQKRTVTGTYLIAKDTIDEFFHDMVWTKRNNIASAGVGDSVDETQGLGFLREFSEFIVRKKI